MILVTTRTVCGSHAAAIATLSTTIPATAELNLQIYLSVYRFSAESRRTMQTYISSHSDEHCRRSSNRSLRADISHTLCLFGNLDAVPTYTSTSSWRNITENPESSRPTAYDYSTSKNALSSVQMAHLPFGNDNDCLL